MSKPLATTESSIGLIAGQGMLPVIMARGMKAAGANVCCVGLRDQADPVLRELCDEFSGAGIVQLGRWIRLLKRWGVTEAVMVGRVDKTRMHRPMAKFRQLPDWRAGRVWYKRLRHDKRNAALLAAVADELAESGITLIDSTTYIPDHLAAIGVMGRVQPAPEQQADIDLGWPLLMKTVELHIGQSMAVANRDIIAVEAVEGTDGMIERAGILCRAKGWTLLKTAASDHDRRADVPTIGVETIEKLAAAGGRCIAVGAGRVILIDKPAVIEAADRAKIALVGMR